MNLFLPFWGTNCPLPFPHRPTVPTTLIFCDIRMDLFLQFWGTDCPPPFPHRPLVPTTLIFCDIYDLILAIFGDQLSPTLSQQALSSDGPFFLWYKNGFFYYFSSTGDESEKYNPHRRLQQLQQNHWTLLVFKIFLPIIIEKINDYPTFLVTKISALWLSVNKIFIK